jgi:gliding motility associated protien GldN
MKLFNYLIVFTLLFALGQDCFAQDNSGRRTRTRERNSEAKNLPELTERAKIKNEEESKGPTHIVWLREIYRYVDLTEEQNSPLYFPAQPIGDRMNLFTLIFKLLSENSITAYKYIDGKEIFTPENELDFKLDVLDRFQILYTTEGSGNNLKYVVEESDLPSEDVKMYMVKEGYYFDQATGKYATQVIAICPMQSRIDYYSGGTETSALFWITYDEIRPYISREMIMTSNYNNAITYTIDDYFRMNMYSGEIVKTTNLMNKSLAQEVNNDPEKLKLAQDSIEKQLTDFKDNLWIYKDPVPEKESKEDKEGKVSEEEDDANDAKKSVKKKKTTSKVKEKKSNTKSSGNSKSSPTKSVRRGNR